MMSRDTAWHHHLPGMLLRVEADALCEVIYKSGGRETGYCHQLNWIDGGIEQYRILEMRPPIKPDEAGQDI
jgi:hypothetical protein